MEKCLANNLLNLDLDPRSTMQFVTRHGAGFGKPQLPGVALFEEHSLCDCINADSPNMFEILRIPMTFLGKPVKEWEEDDGYSFERNFIGTLRVCNVSAQRGVKLVADFLHLAKKEENLQNYVQVVEKDRRKVPNLRKHSLAKE